MKVLFLLAVVVATTAFDFPEEWIEWKNLYNKEYDNELLEIQRHIIWQANKKLIDEHNAHSDLFGFTRGLNEFSDLSSSEFVATYTGFRSDLVGLDDGNSTKDFDDLPNTDIPDDVDWIARGAVNTPENQGGCGSCYSFASTGAVEGAHQIKTGRLLSLSEQQIVDCSGSYGNNGCDGGLMTYTYRYLIRYGSQSDSSYPYEAQVGRCRHNPQAVVSRISDFVNVKSNSVNALLTAIANKGPISVAIDATDLSDYKSGIYKCTSPVRLNHAVLAVGYGGGKRKKYYIVKNSWGTRFGEDGYFRLTRNTRKDCGILKHPSYPIAA